MKTFIHIGLHKTASTYLQTEVFPALKNSFFVSRPTTQYSYELASLQYLDESLYNKKEVGDYYELLKSRAADKNLFLSDEAFSGKAQRFGYINRSIIADRFAELCSDAEIIIVLRNPIDILLSLYNQYVKTGGTQHYKKYFKQLDRISYFNKDNFQSGWDVDALPINTQADNILIDYFEYNKLIEVYKKRFKRVHILYMERFREEGYLKSKILEIFGENLEINKARKTVNQSLPNNSLPVYAVANRFINIVFQYKSGLRKKLFKYDVSFTKRNIIRDYLEEKYGQFFNYEIDDHR
tara:strand:- start:82 stop:966 length:885 start_codon:yes stop_codon:yes gene_type:complete